MSIQSRWLRAVSVTVMIAFGDTRSHGRERFHMSNRDMVCVIASLVRVLLVLTEGSMSTLAVCFLGDSGLVSPRSPVLIPTPVSTPSDDPAARDLLCPNSS